MCLQGNRKNHGEVTVAPDSEQRNNKIVTLYGKGIRIDELCEEFHLSYDTIRKIIKTNL